MQLARQLVTEAMYLAMERASKVKHELRDSELWAMPGASPRHNRLTVKCATQLDRALGAGTCVPLSSDQRIHIPETGNYCYPDVTVVCGDPRYHAVDSDSILNPRLIVEVLSQSTQRHDRGAKFEDYRSIDTFEEYVLVWQDRVRIEVRRREDERRWTIETFGAGEHVELRSVRAELDVDALYAGVFQLKGDADPPSL